MPKHSSDNDPTILQPAEKPVVILVHGFRGSPIGLEKIAQILRKHGYDVHVPAIPPFSKSERLPDYTPRYYAEYLAKYARSHDLQRPVLVGHSMGSLVVASALQLYPKVFYPKAVLMSPISKRTALPFRTIAPLSSIAPRKVVDYATTKYLFATKHDRPLFQETLTITNDCSNDHPPLRSELIRATKFSTNYAITDFHMRQKLLLLAGEKDRLIPTKQTLAAAEILQAEVKFLPNTGHLHNYEQPNETAAAIMEFLESTE